MAGKSTISITFKLSGDTKGFKDLAKDADGLRAVMASTLRQSEGLKSSLINWSAAVQGLQAVQRSVTQVSSALNTLTADSESFGKAMSEANTMASKSGEEFNGLKNEIVALSKEIPLARDLLAGGLYQTISNGVPEDNWISFLTSSARSAVGGLADVNKVVGVTSTIIKNYEKSWSDAGEIQDKIQLTAKNGVTSFEQLAASLPKVTGNSATLGVSIDELLASFATLTGVSGNTAEVATQLSAIFSALVKPSSQAAETAAQMGFQFDAAAIKAAGGFQNFLQQLDSSVKAYASASGRLEQEIYGNLFGSAEAVRALIPLQGALAEKFGENVLNMKNSAGTMDAAFDEMCSTGEAATQMMKNQRAALIDIIAGVASAVRPYVDFGAGLLATASNVAILVSTLKQLNAASRLQAFFAATSNITSSSAGLSKAVATARLFIVQFGQAVTQGTKGLRLFAIAWKGMLISTGIGAAIAGVASIIAHFATTAEEAAESVEKLDDASDEYVRAATAAKTKIDAEIKSLSDLIKAKKDTAAAVAHLNSEYGKEFGLHNTAEEWYDVLTQKSQLYIKQIGYEAQARALASKIAEAAIKKEMAATKMAQLESTGKDKQTVSSAVGGGNNGTMTYVTYETETTEYAQAKKDYAESVDLEAGYSEQLEAVGRLVGEVVAQMGSGLSAAGEEVKINAMSWQQLSDAIDKTEKSLKNTLDPDKINTLKQHLQQLKAQKAALEGRLGIGSGSGAGKSTVENPDGSASFFTSAEQFEKRRKYLRDAMDAADAETRAKLEDEVRLLDFIEERWKNIGRFKAHGVQPVERFSSAPTIPGTDGPAPKITDFKPVPAKVTNSVKKLKDETKQEIDLMGQLHGMWSGFKSGVKAIESTIDVIEESNSGWEKFVAVVDACFQIFSAVAQIITAVTTIIEALTPVVAVATGAHATETAAIKTNTSAKMTNAAAGYMSAHAEIPFAGFGIGAGFASAAMGLVQGLNAVPFAKGGIVTGPTLGFVGEYPGAAHNPEVIAPLDKLKQYITPAGSLDGLKLTTELRGSHLYAVVSAHGKKLSHT